MSEYTKTTQSPTAWQRAKLAVVAGAGLIGFTSGTGYVAGTIGRWLEDLALAVGAGRVGFVSGTGYTAGTLGRWLEDLATSVGASLVGWIQSGTGAVARLAQDKLRERVSVFDFMSAAQIADTQLTTPLLDHTAAIQAARDYIAGLTRPARLIFPSGTYRYATSPNWAIQDAEIIAEGEVRLRYIGTGNAVIIDAGAGAELVYDVTMGRFIVEAPSTALNGVFVRSVHHSRLSFNVRGAGTTSAGLLVNFAVCTIFDNYTCSVNEAGWYGSAKPAQGMKLDLRGAGESTSYCLFVNPVVEGPTTGGLLTEALGNQFHGGTFEGCTSIGINIAEESRENKFYGTDFEVNTTHDVYCQGYENNFYGIDADKQITLDSAAKKNRFFGGSMKNITLVAGSTKNIFSGVTYDRFSSGGVISDSGTYNRFDSCFNPAGAYLGKVPVRTVVTVGASPYTYTNDSGDNQQILVASGTVSNITYARGGTGDTITYVTGTMYTLRPGDGLIITYTVAPTVIAYK